MAKGGQSQQTTGSQNIPNELSGLYKTTGENLQRLQEQNPVSDYNRYNPVDVAPLSGTSQKSLGYLNQNLDEAMGTPLEQSPIAQAGHRYFEGAIAPGITNQATLSGLGRSTANTNALAAAEAQTALPLLQGEQQRRDQMISGGLQAGDIERGVTQEANNARYADFLRRQGLAEQGLFGPMGQLPSTFGQSSTSKTKGGGGGMFK